VKYAVLQCSREKKSFYGDEILVNFGKFTGEKSGFIQSLEIDLDENW
jgi:hypothetical protein